MGATTSRPAPEFTEKRRQQETLVVQARELADNLATLDLNGIPAGESGTLDGSLFGDWEHAAAKVSQSSKDITNIFTISRTLFSLYQGQSSHIPTLARPCSADHQSSPIVSSSI